MDFYLIGLWGCVRQKNFYQLYYLGMLGRINSV